MESRRIGGQIGSRIFQRCQRFFEGLGLPSALLRCIANPAGRLLCPDLLGFLSHAAIVRGVVVVVPDSVLQPDDQPVAVGE